VPPITVDSPWGPPAPSTASRAAVAHDLAIVGLDGLDGGTFAGVGHTLQAHLAFLTLVAFGRLPFFGDVAL
jgi:hypothetical protein